MKLVVEIERGHNDEERFFFFVRTSLKFDERDPTDNITDGKVALVKCLTDVAVEVDKFVKSYPMDESGNLMRDESVSNATSSS